ncbi:uncharacterized protein V1510DRAFT_432315 [Dipodascopsis tothii]|uniref:uncharacterized protein n=1 Tax=Dipodascopsis tothii TaxID=44089 RepID=UPI0034CE7DAC
MGPADKPKNGAAGSPLSPQDLLYFDSLLSAGPTTAAVAAPAVPRSYATDLLSLAAPATALTAAPTAGPLGDARAEAGSPGRPESGEFGGFVSGAAVPERYRQALPLPGGGPPKPAKPGVKTRPPAKTQAPAKVPVPPAAGPALPRRSLQPTRRDRNPFAAADMRRGGSTGSTGSSGGSASPPGGQINMNQPLRFGQHLQDGRLVGAARGAAQPDRPPAEPAARGAAQSAARRAAPPDLLAGADDLPPPGAPAVPPPDVVLARFIANYFPLPQPLFADLAPLAYPLKRRVLSNARTKHFLKGLLSGIHIGQRLCAGRARRGGRYDADREARELARLWQDLSHRLKGVGMLQLPAIDPSHVLPRFRGDPGELCPVCGVGAFETVRGATIDARWNDDKRGHANCMNWWDHQRALAA